MQNVEVMERIDAAQAGRSLHGAQGASEQGLRTIETEYGRIHVNPSELMLGELVVTDEGAELEVVGLEPLRFELAPEEEEDWGE